MSNQPQANVADERAAFEAAMPEGHSRDRKMPDGSYNSPFMFCAWWGWQAARAAIQAGADAAKDEGGREAWTRKELLNEIAYLDSIVGMANKSTQKWKDRAIAAGAPAETPKPDESLNSVLQSVFGQMGGTGPCPIQFAAQPATAPATMLDCPECEGTGRVSSVALCQNFDESGIVPAPATDAKRLVWFDPQRPNSECPYNHVIAQTPFGRILITWKGWKDDPAPTVDEHPVEDYFFVADTVKEAMIAAEEAYFDAAAMLSANSPREAG